MFGFNKFLALLPGTDLVLGSCVRNLVSCLVSTSFLCRCRRLSRSLKFNIPAKKKIANLDIFILYSNILKKYKNSFKRGSGFNACLSFVLIKL